LRYPFSKYGVYLSVVLAALSFFFTLVFFSKDIVMLVFYLILTFLLTVIGLAMKIHIFSRKESESLRGYSSEKTKDHKKLKILLLAFGFIVALVMPLVLLSFLDVRSWFISLSSFISGISLSEVAFFRYCQCSEKG